MPDGNGGILDTIRDVAGKVTDKVKGVFQDHGDKVDQAVDKAADFVDDKTGGRYSEHVDKARDVAHDAVDKLGGDEGTGGDQGGAAAP